MLFLGMGRVYLAKGEYDKARNYLERAELENKKYVDGHPEIQIEAAETMIRLAQQSAQYALAEKYALKIVTAGHFAEYLKHKSLAHRTLYEIYTAWNMPEQAAEHLAQYFVVRDAFDQRKKSQRHLSGCSSPGRGQKTAGNGCHRSGPESTNRACVLLPA